MVMGPSLPINMMTMHISLLPTLSVGVMPVESPTVANALVISKSASIPPMSGSITSSSHVPIRMTASPNSTMTVALRNADAGIEDLNAFSERFVAAETMPVNSTNMVVDFTPPPVDPGDAPMNISAIIAVNPASLKLPSDLVENPAVRADTEWNSAPIQLRSSVSFSSMVPNAIKNTVMLTTPLVCIENLRHLKRLRQIS